MEELDEGEKCLRQKRDRRVGGEGLVGGKKGVDMLEELEVGLHEAVEDKVDLGEEPVRAELGAPPEQSATDRWSKTYLLKIE